MSQIFARKLCYRLDFYNTPVASHAALALEHAIFYFRPFSYVVLVVWNRFLPTFSCQDQLPLKLARVAGTRGRFVNAADFTPSRRESDISIANSMTDSVWQERQRP
jgi:hypothetical protein